MNNFQKVARNTFFLLLSEVFLKILGLAWTIYLARSLNVELFGRYSFIHSFIALFSFLPDLGVGIIVIRDISKNRKKANIYLGNSLILNGVLALFTFLLILFLTFFVGHSSEVKLLIILSAVTLFVSTLRSVGIFYFDAIEKMEYSAALNSFNTIMLYAFGFIFFSLGWGITGIFLGMLLGTVVSLFITWIATKKYVKPRIKVDMREIKHLLYEGLPLGIASFAAIIYANIDTVILTRLQSEHAAGIYNVAIPFSFGLIGLLNVPFVVALFPTLSRLSVESKSRFNQAIKKSLLIIAGWSFPIAFIVMLSAPLIPLLFGAKYVDAVSILKIHIYIVPFASLSALLYKILIILGKQKIYLYVSIVGAVLNIVLNIILIPLVGIPGAAYSAVITQIVLFLIYFLAVITCVKSR